MSAGVRSPERPSAVPTDRLGTGTNQRRAEEAFRLLGMAAVRIAADPNPSAYVLDLASRHGQLQDVWCREEISTTAIFDADSANPGEISPEVFGAVNAERYDRAQKALAAMLIELCLPDFCGSASLRVRGQAGELSDDIRAESRRQWRF